MTSTNPRIATRNTATPVMLNFCPVLGLCICSASTCGFALRPIGVVNHLVKKHKVNLRLAREEEAKYAHLELGLDKTSKDRRYLENPVASGEEPLPRLHSLPVTTQLLHCTICGLYCNVRQAYRTHLHKKHKGHPNHTDAIHQISSGPFRTGQSIFGGRKRFSFPVKMVNFEKESQVGRKRITAENILSSLENPSKEELDHRDSIALEDYSMSAWAEELKLANFLKKSKLDCHSAFELSYNIFPPVKREIQRLILAYFEFFARRNPRIPSPFIEMVRIRDSKGEASFDLYLPLKTKLRYARSAARIVVAILNLMDKPEPLDTVCLPESIQKAANSFREILRELPKNIGSPSLHIPHNLLKELVLRPVKASEGETVPVENLCLLALSGYSTSSEGRTRLGDAEDASHLAAALQYCCQMAALGEFLVSPYGFGDRQWDESEEERRNKVEAMLCTKSVTPAAFLRRTLYGSKRLSAGETPRLSFIPCHDHGEGVCCGFLGALELRLNGPPEKKSVSLSRALHKIQENAMHMIRNRIMRGFTLPTLFWENVLSLNDKISCKDPGYWFGAIESSKKWADSFALHAAMIHEPILQEKDRGQWSHTENADAWMNSCDQFIRILYCLIHICSGGPPRGTELGEAKIRNTITGRRNMFLYKRMVAYLISYSKTSKQVAPKPIARFPDPVTSRLLLLFVIFVKPVMAKVIQSTLGGEGGERDFLFTRNGEVLQSHVIYDSFRKTLHTNGVPIGILDYRHYRTGIAKEFLSKDFDAIYGDCGDFAQAGHSERTAVANYAHIPCSFTELNATAAEALLKYSMKWHGLLELTDKWNDELWEKFTLPIYIEV